MRLRDAHVRSATGRTHPRPPPLGFPAHPSTDRLPGPGTETLPARAPPRQKTRATPRRDLHTPQSSAAWSLRGGAGRLPPGGQAAGGV